VAVFNEEGRGSDAALFFLDVSMRCPFLVVVAGRKDGRRVQRGEIINKGPPSSDRASNSRHNSRERLDHERQVFFSAPYTLEQHQLLQEVQMAALCLDAKSNKVPVSRTDDGRCTASGQ
jgi:hypothetical protein